MIHTHAAVPDVELFEEVRIDFEEIDGGGVRQSDELHETEQHEQVVQFHELLAQFLLIAGESHAVKEFTQVLPELRPSHIFLRRAHRHRQRSYYNSCGFTRMLLSDLTELPRGPELAVIINVGTKYVTTLALLSALRYAEMPLVVL